MFCSTTSPGKTAAADNTGPSSSKSLAPTGKKGKAPKNISGKKRKEAPKNVSAKETNKKKKTEETAEEIAKKRNIKNAKLMTLFFHKLKGKIGVMEALTPSWHWVCNVEKHKGNSRWD